MCLWYQRSSKLIITNNNNTATICQVTATTTAVLAMISHPILPRTIATGLFSETRKVGNLQNTTGVKASSNFCELNSEKFTSFPFCKLAPNFVKSQCSFRSIFTRIIFYMLPEKNGKITLGSETVYSHNLNLNVLHPTVQQYNKDFNFEKAVIQN